MKNVCLLLALAITFNTFSQQTDFTVAAGATKTLVATERTISVKTLSLGDNSTIIIPPSMDGWTVTAADVIIGKGVRIVGMGVNGSHGSAGSNGANASTSCTMGGHAYSGVNATNGTAGKNISLSLKIRQFGSLAIWVNGGNGGFAGNGGIGGTGGSATCTCNAGAGGNGGNGGRGGSGGAGGNVTISYSTVGSVVVTDAQFFVNNAGGSKGTGGAAGHGGKGGPGGGCTDPKSLLRPAGANGNNGVPGMDGLVGAKGVTNIQSK